MFSRGVEVAGNRVEYGYVGSAVMYGAEAWVHDNAFSGHVGPLAFGLLVHEQNDSRFEGNRITRNTVGMLVVSFRARGRGAFSEKTTWPTTVSAYWSAASATRALRRCASRATASEATFMTWPSTIPRPTR